jgi:hypothetical protein
MNSPLPRAVQRQLDQAEALAQQSQAAPAPAPAAPVAPPAPAQAPAQPAAPAQAPAAPAAPAVDYEQKFRSLQGMYNREVPDLRAANARAISEISSLREQLTALTAAVQAKPTQPEQPQAPTVDPRDARVFGEDMVEMVNKYAQQTFAQAKAEFARALAAVEQRVQALEAAVTGVKKRTADTMESQFYAALDQLVPDWKAINADPEWLAWLAEVDDVYNIPRQAALDAAFERLNAANVAAVFKKYAQTRPKPAAAGMQSLITPSEGGGAPPAPPAPPARQLITQDAVQRFYNDVAKGRYRGREAEQAQIEAEINLAAQEGRII